MLTPTASCIEPVNSEARNRHYCLVCVCLPSLYWPPALETAPNVRSCSAGCSACPRDLAVGHRPLRWTTSRRGSTLPDIRASPRFAWRPIELTWRSAPLREAQAMNWLLNGDEALLSFESKICEPPVNFSVIEGKGIG